MSRAVTREKTDGRYCLGLDLGSGSLGWAVVLDQEDGVPPRVAMGVRRFDAGVQGDIESGRDESRATARRDARGPRRQTWRRQYRLRKVFRVLQEMDLLPSSDDASHDSRMGVLGELDRDLRKEYLEAGDHAAHQVLPYQLRTLALDEQLPAHALGRALYHLAQRRGFLSNRKAGKKDEDAGVVKAGITELAEEMERRGCRTLGEYFASLDPEQQKIRGRWTGRGMYIDEFEKIWAAQAEYHPEWTDKEYGRLRDAIFDQRKLKSQKGLIGACDLERTKRRAPAACMEYQEFRLLQRVNDLVMIAPSSQRFSLAAHREMELLPDAAEKRESLIAELEANDSLSFAKIGKILGLKAEKQDGKSVKWTFNLQEGGEKGIKGNTTATRLLAVLGDRWQAMGDNDRHKLVDEILAFESEEVLVRRLVRGWKMSEKKAKEVAELHFEQGYGSLSRKAIRALLPRMRRGEQFTSARDAVYGKEESVGVPEEHLPANHECKLFRNLRNPAVERALSELRAVVNAVIREYGKPRLIRIELARELKHSRDRRRRMTDRNRKNEGSRNDARKKILEEMKDERYCSPHNILKVRLAEECNWECPYTGRSICMRKLVGDEPQFEVEHIIPFSRSFDNSFVNKTLCYHAENRRKSNRTPFETYSDTDRWDEILVRVGRFRGERSLVARKLDLFKREKLDEGDEFTNRQLTDTAYMSRLAADYLALLYGLHGGRTDAEGKLRVQVSPGRVTSYLRQRWNLNSILGLSGEKERGDHRHHAIDALVVALTGPGEVHQLSRAAEEAEQLGQRGLFVPMDEPWEDFLSDVFSAVEGINVSSRVSRKLNGQLHDATILSPPKPAIDKNGKPILVHHVRKKLESLSKNMVDDIVDDRIREEVKKKLAELGGDPAKAFQDPSDHPYVRAKDGRVIPIHKVRIRKSDKPIAVGFDSKRRYVVPGENHHLGVIAILDTDGKEKKWDYAVVTRFDVQQRKRRDEDVYLRPQNDQVQFKFSLARDEHVLMCDDDGVERLYRVTAISRAEAEFVLHSDARPRMVRKKEKARIRCTPKRLKERGARKVTVDPLGNILPAND